MSTDHHTSPVETATRLPVPSTSRTTPARASCFISDCVYSIHDQTHVGPDAILDSYQANGDEAASKFDAIAYGSAVRADTDRWAVITFTDRITHAGRSHTHTCEQRVRVNAAGLIDRIEHRDLPDEREQLDAFKRSL